MARDYGEHLDEAALGLLAEATGLASRADAPHFFRHRPHDISIALGRPEAAQLLNHPHPETRGDQHHLLQLAIAVHRTAEDICQAGWTTNENSFVDLSLLSFSGQTDYQAFVVGLLASFLTSPAPTDLGFGPESHPTTSADRVLELIDLCANVGATERAGALRLLGDEALFTSGVFPELAHAHPADDTLLATLEPVLPRAVVALFPDLRIELVTLLDVHLMFGPIWYRMGAQNLIHTQGRQALNNISTDFATARRFLVRVSQGPLVHLRQALYPQIR